MTFQETIVALASPSGAGAIAVIRLSGTGALTIAEQVFQSVSEKSLSKQKTHTIHLGHIVDEGKVLDQVLLSIFKNPHSYTGEDVIEISCHGSTYIQQQIIQLLLPNVGNHWILKVILILTYLPFEVITLFGIFQQAQQVFKLEIKIFGKNVSVQ